MQCGDPDFCVVSIPLGWGGYLAVWLGCDPQLFSLLGPWFCDTFSTLLLIPSKEVVSLSPPGAYHLERGSPGNCFLGSGIVGWKNPCLWGQNA